MPAENLFIQRKIFSVMRIAIEAQRIFRGNKHGMDFVALECIRELQELDKENEYFIIVSPGTDRTLNESANFHIVEISCPTYPLWEQIALPSALRKIRPDILHCTSNTAPLFCKFPLILTLHDIIFLEKRQKISSSFYQNLGWYYRKLVVPAIVPKCRNIVTVSNFEAGRIKEALHLDDNIVKVVYNGYSSHFRIIDGFSGITKKYIESKEYLFFLGNTDPKKNTLRTLKGYSIYLKRSKNPLPLLIADLKESVIDSILSEGGIGEIKQMLRFPGYIPNNELPMIYNGAFAFIYTSLRESFGIPILEAMACGTPVITSNTSAIPEVAGDGAILVDPYKEEEIAGAILRLEEDDKFRESIKCYGLERVKEFSWKSAANELLKIYNNVRVAKDKN